MKPWGSPPTGATFWVQLLTTAAVLIISLLKGVETSVALVISTGPASHEQALADPKFLALGIVVMLFCIVIAAGYLMHWKQMRGARAEGAATAEGAKSVKASATQSEDEAMEEQDEGEKGESGADGQQQSKGAEQQHFTPSHPNPLDARQTVMHECQKVYDTAIAQGLSPAQADQRAQACAQRHQQQRELKRVQRDALEARCPPTEVQRRVEAQKHIFRAESVAQRAHMQECERVHREAVAEGKSPGEVQARVQLCARAHHEAWMKQRNGLVSVEETVRREVIQGLKQRDEVKIDPEVRELILSRVRIRGLAARPELNDKEGTVTRYIKDKGRFAIAVDGSDSAPLLLKPANLTKIGADGKELDDDEPPPPLM